MNDVYPVPLVPSGSFVHPLSISLKEVAVGAPATVVVLVGAAADDAVAFSAASLFVAMLALLASTPVPAASPMTAADSSAMMQDNMNTSRLHPQSTPFDLLVDGSAAGCWEYVEAAAGYGDVAGAVPAYVELSVYPSAFT